MKNKLSIILACLWIVMAIFFGWLLISRLSNGNIHLVINSTGTGRSFSDDGFTITINDLSDGDINTLYKSYTFTTTDIDRFNVGVISASVHFQPYEGSDYLVELYGNWNEKIEPEVSVNKDNLKIKTPSFKNNNWGNLGSRKIVIKVPESECAKLFDADVSTVSGSIHTSELCFSEFGANTTSGSIHTDGYIGELSADSVSGSIHVNGTCETIQCNTVSGSIHVDTDNPLTDENNFNSVSGSIHLTIPEGHGFEFEWETLSGSVSNEFYNGKCGKSGSQIIGDGNAEIQVNTVSGSIHLNKN